MCDHRYVTVRILRIVARMNVGGPAVEISTLMAGLNLSVYEQCLLTGACGPDEADFLAVHGAPWPHRTIPGLGRAVRPLDDLKALWQVMHSIRTFQPDVIHTHTAKAGTLGRVAAMLTRSKAKRVHTYHGHVLHGYFRGWQTRLIATWEAWLARHTTALVTVGDEVRRDLLDADIGTPQQYRVIPPGITEQAPPSRTEARRQLQLPPDAPVVSYVGRLTTIKRPDRLLQTIALLRQQVPNLLVVVAGGGDLAEITTRQATEQCLPIRFLGWRPDIATVFAASDVTVLTSDNEGTPISLIEAGLCGVPAVATDVGAVSEVVRHGITGLLVEPEPAALAQALSRILHDPALAEALGSKAQISYQDDFSTARFLHRHESLYKDLLTARQSPAT